MGFGRSRREGEEERGKRGGEGDEAGRRNGRGKSERMKQKSREFFFSLPVFVFFSPPLSIPFLI
jgi:hypothetical protein